MRPSVGQTTSASATGIKISELNPRGPLPCCLRFTSPVARRRCKTRYRPTRYGVDRAGFAPAGFHQEVSCAHRHSPSSTLSWRYCRYNPRHTFIGSCPRHLPRPVHEILSALVAGGMGEVYRARDARLGRDATIRSCPSRSRVDKGAGMARAASEHANGYPQADSPVSREGPPV